MSKMPSYVHSVSIHYKKILKGGRALPPPPGSTLLTGNKEWRIEEKIMHEAIFIKEHFSTIKIYCRLQESRAKGFQRFQNFTFTTGAKKGPLQSIQS